MQGEIKLPRLQQRTLGISQWQAAPSSPHTLQSHTVSFSTTVCNSHVSDFWFWFLVFTAAPHLALVLFTQLSTEPDLQSVHSFYKRWHGNINGRENFLQLVRI